MLWTELSLLIVELRHDQRAVVAAQELGVLEKKDGRRNLLGFAVEFLDLLERIGEAQSSQVWKPERQELIPCPSREG
jgi:hypothetical protein